VKRQLLVILIAAGLVGGCSSFYEVTNLSTGTTYYTKKVKRLRDGSVEFRDEESRGTVTISESEIREIDRDEFRRATR